MVTLLTRAGDLQTFQVKLPANEIASFIDEFRTRHLSELTEVRAYSLIEGSQMMKRVWSSIGMLFSC